LHLVAVFTHTVFVGIYCLCCRYRDRDWRPFSTFGCWMLICMLLPLWNFAIRWCATTDKVKFVTDRCLMNDGSNSILSLSQDRYFLIIKCEMNW